ncbi:MAG: DUF302 domain-containing protein [Gammaproteobacteria bacterium]|nr:DUF302 domain-containing protein [Gammaproteobacteria bacterium]
MNTNTIRSVAVFVMLSAAGTSLYAADNPAFMKFHAKGDFATVLSNVKQALETAQFVISAEENLSKGLEKNKQLFPEGTWNSIGFDNVTAVHFCSLVFNQEVFNINMDWTILCPYKLSIYSMKKAPQDITVIMQRPTFQLAQDPHPKAKEIGKKMEDRIVNAIKDGLAR